LAASRTASKSQMKNTNVVSASGRISFAKIHEPLEVPNLLDLQVESFDWLMGNETWQTRVSAALAAGRTDVNTKSGLEEIFEEISPIEDFSGSMSLSFSDPRFDEVKAVREFFLSGGDLLDCRARIKDINSLRAHPDFSGIAMAFKRAKNILRQAKAELSGSPDEASFEKDEERALYGDIKAMSGRLQAHIGARDYAKGLSELLSIKGSLDNFFDKVMVMDENPKVRENRLNLIKSLVTLFEGVADLSQLQ